MSPQYFLKNNKNNKNQYLLIFKVQKRGENVFHILIKWSSGDKTIFS